MFELPEPIDSFAPKTKADDAIVAEIDGVTIRLASFRLASEEMAYGVRMHKGDPENGPYFSIITELYLTTEAAFLDALPRVLGFGVKASEFCEAVGLETAVISEDME